MQLLTGKEYPALYRSQRQAETVGYLAVLEARNVHKERDAVVTRQAVDNAIYLLCIVSVVGDVIVALTRSIDMEQIVGMVDKYLVAHLLAIVVDEYVAHYGIHPALEVCPGRILVHITQRLKRCFLQKIIRLFSVCREFVGKALQLRLHLKQLSPEFCSIQFDDRLIVYTGKIAGV